MLSKTPSKTPSGEPQNAYPTVSSLLTGISPMHCIGRMEPFHQPVGRLAGQLAVMLACLPDGLIAFLTACLPAVLPACKLHGLSS
jgi:hypothetical protein